MEDIYGAGAALLIIIGAVWAYIIKRCAVDARRATADGKWHRVQESVADGGKTRLRVLLVRENEGRGPDRLPIREIDCDSPTWTDQYAEAIAEADTRLAYLNSGEK